MDRVMFQEMMQHRCLSSTSDIRSKETAKEQLRRDLIHYFKNTPEGQAAWERRPRITGEGVADYITIEDMVEALLKEADQ